MSQKHQECFQCEGEIKRNEKHGVFYSAKLKTGAIICQDCLLAELVQMFGKNIVVELPRE